MTNLIGISGRIGSGKDTLAKMIQLAIYTRNSPGTEQTAFLIDYLDRGIFNWDAYSAHNNNTEWQIMKYATKLKQMVCLLIGCTMEQLEDQEFKDSKLGPEWNTPDWIPTVRQLLQRFATEAIRMQVHENAWVNALFADYLKPYMMVDVSGGLPDGIQYPHKWIITDVRFPNEAQAILKRRGILIRVERSGPVTSIHASETALDDYKRWDVRIVNNYTLADLFEEAKKLVVQFDLK